MELPSEIPDKYALTSLLFRNANQEDQGRAKRKFFYLILYSLIRALNFVEYSSYEKFRIDFHANNPYSFFSVSPEENLEYTEKMYSVVEKIQLFIKERIKDGVWVEFDVFAPIIALFFKINVSLVIEQDGLTFPVQVPFSITPGIGEEQYKTDSFDARESVNKDSYDNTLIFSVKAGRRANHFEYYRINTKTTREQQKRVTTPSNTPSRKQKKTVIDGRDTDSEDESSEEEEEETSQQKKVTTTAKKTSTKKFNRVFLHFQEDEFYPGLEKALTSVLGVQVSRGTPTSGSLVLYAVNHTARFESVNFSYKSFLEFKEKLVDVTIVVLALTPGSKQYSEYLGETLVSQGLPLAQLFYNAFTPTLNDNENGGAYERIKSIIDGRIITTSTTTTKQQTTKIGGNVINKTLGVITKTLGTQNSKDESSDDDDAQNQTESSGDEDDENYEDAEDGGDDTTATTTTTTPTTTTTTTTPTTTTTTTTTPTTTTTTTPNTTTTLTTPTTTTTTPTTTTTTTPTTTTTTTTTPTTTTTSTTTTTTTPTTTTPTTTTTTPTTTLTTPTTTTSTTPTTTGPMPNAHAIDEGSNQSSEESNEEDENEEINPNTKINFVKEVLDLFIVDPTVVSTLADLVGSNVNFVKEAQVRVRAEVGGGNFDSLWIYYCTLGIFMQMNNARASEHTRGEALKKYVVDPLQESGLIIVNGGLSPQAKEYLEKNRLPHYLFCMSKNTRTTRFPPFVDEYSCKAMTLSKRFNPLGSIFKGQRFIYTDEHVTNAPLNLETVQNYQNTKSDASFEWWHYDEGEEALGGMDTEMGILSKPPPVWSGGRGFATVKRSSSSTLRLDFPLVYGGGGNTLFSKSNIKVDNLGYYYLVRKKEGEVLPQVLACVSVSLSKNKNTPPLSTTAHAMGCSISRPSRSGFPERLPSGGEVLFKSLLADRLINTSNILLEGGGRRVSKIVKFKSNTLPLEYDVGSSSDVEMFNRFQQYKHLRTLSERDYNGLLRSNNANNPDLTQDIKLLLREEEEEQRTFYKISPGGISVNNEVDERLRLKQLVGTYYILVEDVRRTLVFIIHFGGIKKEVRGGGSRGGTHPLNMNVIPEYLKKRGGLQLNSISQGLIPVKINGNKYSLPMVVLNPKLYRYKASYDVISDAGIHECLRLLPGFIKEAVRGDEEEKKVHSPLPFFFYCQHILATASDEEWENSGFIRFVRGLCRDLIFSYAGIIHSSNARVTELTKAKREYLKEVVGDVIHLLMKPSPTLKLLSQDWKRIHGNLVREVPSDKTLSKQKIWENSVTYKTLGGEEFSATRRKRYSFFDLARLISRNAALQNHPLGREQLNQYFGGESSLSVISSSIEYERNKVLLTVIERKPIFTSKRLKKKPQMSEHREELDILEDVVGYGGEGDERYKNIVNLLLTCDLESLFGRAHFSNLFGRGDEELFHQMPHLTALADFYNVSLKRFTPVDIRAPPPHPFMDHTQHTIIPSLYRVEEEEEENISSPPPQEIPPSTVKNTMGFLEVLYALNSHSNKYGNNQTPFGSLLRGQINELIENKKNA